MVHIWAQVASSWYNEKCLLRLQRELLYCFHLQELPPIWKLLPFVCVLVLLFNPYNLDLSFKLHMSKILKIDLTPTFRWSFSLLLQGYWQRSVSFAFVYFLFKNINIRRVVAQQKKNGWLHVSLLTNININTVVHNLKRNTNLYLNEKKSASSETLQIRHQHQNGKV